MESRDATSSRRVSQTGGSRPASSSIVSASFVRSAAVRPFVAATKSAYAASTAWRGRIGIDGSTSVMNVASTADRTKSTVRGSTTRTSFRLPSIHALMLVGRWNSAYV